jgi:hypothetical protein
MMPGDEEIEGEDEDVLEPDADFSEEEGETESEA